MFGYLCIYYYHFRPDLLEAWQSKRQLTPKFLEHRHLQFRREHARRNSSMSRVPFICSRCLLQLSRPLNTSRGKNRWLLRWQSTAVSSSSTSTSQGIVSPFLVRRAELLAAEHDKLSKQNAEEYDINIAKRIGELAPVAEVYRKLKETEEVYMFHCDVIRSWDQVSKANTIHRPMWNWKLFSHPHINTKSFNLMPVLNWNIMYQQYSHNSLDN